MRKQFPLQLFLDPNLLSLIPFLMSLPRRDDRFKPQRPSHKAAKRPVQGPPARKQGGTSWEKSADWYDKILGERGSEIYQRVVIPSALALLQPTKDERILDLGCGQGVFSRAMSAEGSYVTGIDASPTLIAKAKTYKSRLPIHYLHRDAAKVRDLGPFDAASAILCLQNMPHLDEVCLSAAAVLKPGGRMLWVMNHPCFRIPRQTSWGFDDERKIQYRRLDAYGQPMTIPIIMHPGQKDSETTTSFHLSLTDLMAKAFSAGFMLAGFKEFYSDKESEPGPRARAENRARNEFPLFLGMVWKLIK